MSAILILFIQRSLLHDHLFEEVLLSLKDKDLTKSLLMLFDPQPVFMRDLGHLLFILSMLIEHGLIIYAQSGLILEVHVRLMIVKF